MSKAFTEEDLSILRSVIGRAAEFTGGSAAIEETIARFLATIDDLREQIRIALARVDFFKHIAGSFGCDVESFRADVPNAEEILGLLASIVKVLEKSGQPRAADAVRFLVKTYGDEHTEAEIDRLEARVRELEGEIARRDHAAVVKFAEEGEKIAERLASALDAVSKAVEPK